MNEFINILNQPLVSVLTHKMKTHRSLVAAPNAVFVKPVVVENVRMNSNFQLSTIFPREKTKRGSSEKECKSSVSCDRRVGEDMFFLGTALWITTPICSYIRRVECKNVAQLRAPV